MHRLYCPSRNISGNNIIIDDKQQVHHARDVLRLKLGEEVVICDDKGNEYNSVLENLLSKGMVFKIITKKGFTRTSGASLTVACAIPKGSHMDNIMDQLTQLGVDRIIPLETERVIVKLDRLKKALRQVRWNKIIFNAGQQSQRNVLPILEPIKNIKELLSDSEKFDLKLIPTLQAQRKPLKEIIENSRPSNILVIIGPEGDFTTEEIDMARRAGFIPVSLGELVLRVETAAIAVTSFIRFYLKPTS